MCTTYIFNRLQRLRFTTIQILVGVFYNHTKLSRYKTSNSLFIPFIWSYRVVIRHCSIKTKCCYLIPSILGHKIALTSNDV